MKTNKTQKGITLIALIITVIVLLILAGTAVSIAINGGDIFGKASEARESWNTAVVDEQTKLDDVMSILNTITSGGDITTTPTPSETTVTITINGTPTVLGKATFGEHLGKVVTNYTGAVTTVNEITVSNTYRLYWIDFDNKYGDGAGTIYLKADVPENGATILSQEAVTGELTIDPEGSIIRKLNPELYKNVATNPPPAVNSDNMKAVRWLLNENNWDGLKISSFSAKTNYVVGAPSLEMMMDSYNTHYASVLTGTSAPDYSDITPGERRKLWYKYPLNANSYGYGVGPNADDDVEYSEYTSDNSVYTDTIDSMYYSVSNDYWLSSPSAWEFDEVMLVKNGLRGICGWHGLYHV